MLGGHPIAYRHAGVLPTGLLLLLEVLIVGHLLLLLVGHVARVHARRTGDVGLLSIHIAVTNILGCLCRYLGGIDAVLTAAWVGGIEAGLLSGGVSPVGKPIRDGRQQHDSPE